mgnify:CR=1 FL=1
MSRPSPNVSPTQMASNPDTYRVVDEDDGPMEISSPTAPPLAVPIRRSRQPSAAAAVTSDPLEMPPTQPLLATTTSSSSSDLASRGTLLSTTMNSLCTMIGGGILAIPLAFSKASVIPGLCIVFISCALSLYSVRLLVWCSDLTKRYSFRAIMCAAFPDVNARTIGIIVETIIVAANSAALIVYVRVIADALPPVVDHVVGRRGIWSEEGFWLGMTAMVFALLSIVKQLHELLPVAILGFTALLFVSCVVIAHFFSPSLRESGIDFDPPVAAPTTAPSVYGVFGAAAHRVASSTFAAAYGVPPTSSPLVHPYLALLVAAAFGNETNTTTTFPPNMTTTTANPPPPPRPPFRYIVSDVALFKGSAGWLPAMSTIVGAFLYQMNVPPLYQELSHRSPKRLMVTGTVALSTALLLYISVGLLGYLMFGDAAINSKHAGGNILNNFSSTDVLVDAARLLLVFHMVCAFPIYAVVARRSLNLAIFGTEDCPLWRRVAEGWGIVACVVVSATFVPGIGYVVAFSGAAFGTTVGFTIPALMFYRLARKHNRLRLAMLNGDDDGRTDGRQVVEGDHREGGGGTDWSAAQNEGAADNRRGKGHRSTTTDVTRPSETESCSVVEQRLLDASTPPSAFDGGRGRGGEEGRRRSSSIQNGLVPLPNTSMEYPRFSNAMIYGALALAVFGALETVTSIGITISELAEV